jgi:uncharacterized Fe-S cluster-containing radical SAM superfamily protein
LSGLGLSRGFEAAIHPPGKSLNAAYASNYSQHETSKKHQHFIAPEVMERLSSYCKNFVEGNGTYIGGFEGAEPPGGATEVPEAPDDAR